MSATPTPPHTLELRALLKAHDSIKEGDPEALTHAKFFAAMSDTDAWCQYCDRPGKLGDKCKRCGSYHTVDEEDRAKYTPEEKQWFEEERERQDRADANWQKVLEWRAIAKCETCDAPFTKENPVYARDTPGKPVCCDDCWRVVGVEQKRCYHCGIITETARIGKVDVCHNCRKAVIEA
jgi:hypothetical protein